MSVAFLILSLVRKSVSALPHPLFGVSSSEILGNSGFCHSTGFSLHHPPRGCFPSFLIIITQRFTQPVADSAILKANPPPQHVIPARALLLLLVSVTTMMQESSSGAQVCSFPVQLGPSPTHTSQLSGYPAVREQGSSERCRSLWAMTPKSHADFVEGSEGRRTGVSLHIHGWDTGC